MLLSIIIPIYNSKRYLHKCISSLANQLDAEAEIILIDDGSTDGSGDICDAFSTQYANIKVFHKANAGVSSARNLGLAKACGRYIAWVDSDDYVAENWYSAIKEVLLQDIDIVCFDHYRVEHNKSKAVVYGGTSRLLEKNAYIAELTLDDKVKSYLWMSVFKKDLFASIKFPTDTSLMEDYSIIHKLFYKADSIYYLAKPLYFYLIRSESVSHSVNFSNYFKAALIAKERYQWLTDMNVNVSNVAYIKHYLFFIIAVIKEGQCSNWKKEMRICHKEICDNIRDLMFSKEVSLKNKVKYAMEYTDTIKIIYKILSIVKFGRGVKPARIFFDINIGFRFGVVKAGALQC